MCLWDEDDAERADRSHTDYIPQQLRSGRQRKGRFELKPIPHPKPFQSQLWPHLDLIRKLRLSRRSWPEIAAELSTVGIRMNPWAIRRFFKRAQGRKLPLGFGAVATPAPVATPPAQPAVRKSPRAEDLLKPIPNHERGPFSKWYQQRRTAASQDADGIYDDARKALRE
jgi:hypothetical protein